MVLRTNYSISPCMLHINDKKLVWFTKYLPIAIIISSALILNLIMITGVDHKVRALVDLVRLDYIAAQKRLIEAQVLQVSQQIEQSQHLAEAESKRNLKKRIDRAYTVAQNIYSSNQHLSHPELKAMILNEIRRMSFANKENYIYVYDMQGTALVHPIRPEFENTNRMGASNDEGQFVVAEQIALLQEAKSGFARYKFKRPGHGEQEFEKLSHIRRFEPYGWFFGSGIYLDDIKATSYQRILDILANVTIGKDGYIFVFEENGNTLLRRNEILIGSGQNLYQEIGESFKTQVLSQSRNGGFVDYITKDSKGVLGPKTSYVKKIEGWNWVVGTGIYLNHIQTSIEKRKEELMHDSRNEFGLVLVFSVVATLICIFLSVFVSRKISLRFMQMEQRIADDFNRLKNSRRRLKHMARHDALTALPNRSELEHRVNHAIAKSKLQDKLVAIVFVDLDDFKRINDQYGHGYGDELLKQISHRFEKCLDEHDIVSRFGGDEFVFCLPELDELAQAEQKVAQIQSIFNKAFDLRGITVTTQCSAGVAMYPYDGIEVDELLTKADIVLYKAKDSQKGEAVFYDEVINKQVTYDFRVEEQLKLALKNREISVVYQPQVDSKTQKVRGVEALCRWNNAELGFVSPLDFIPAAERLGLIQELGEYVLQQACEDTLLLMPNGQDAIGVSVNVSPKQVLESGFAKRVEHLVSATGLSANRVTLEITENILIKDLHIVEPVLRQLRELGFGISLDDFGTGFSSLNYLNTLPVSEIKIDRSFIGKLNTSEHSATLVRAIIDIGNSCQMKVVAEGVETDEQMAKLQQYECDLLQGFYFDKPLPVAGLMATYFPKSPQRARNVSEHAEACI